MNVDFAAFVFCDDLCCAGDCSTVKIQRHLVLCHAKKFPSAVHGRIDSFSWETTASLFSSFPNHPDPSVKLMIFVKKSDGTVS